MTNEALEQKYVRRLKEIAKEHATDPETMHVLADRTIMAALDELGLNDMVNEFLLITENSYYA